MTLRYLFFLLSICFCSSWFSQVKISGKIFHKKTGVEGVNISLKNTYDGATSDKNGIFSFETSEKGKFQLVFSHPKYLEVQSEIDLQNTPILINIELKEQIREIDAVVISAGSIEASDKKRATALLSPIDIYTTAGANGQISSALNFLPGVQKIGETEGLFVRGGTGNETKIFMDGSLVNSYFANSVPGVAGRDRFNTSLFKGNVFSSGGYSALYGQALSGALMLESVDLPEQSSIDVGVSPIFVNLGMQKLKEQKQLSFGASFGYSNLNLMQKITQFNTQFTQAPEGLNADANFRLKTKAGGMLKYYGMFGNNKIGITSPSLEPEYDFSNMKLNGNSTFQNLSFRQKMGKNLLNLGFSYTYNQNVLDFSKKKNQLQTEGSSLENTGNYVNLKAVLERKINKISALRGGIEINTSNEEMNFGQQNKIFKDNISSLFLESDWGFSNYFSIKLGVRAENSSNLNKNNIAPRFAMAYKISDNWTSSLAYGWFYQNPESRFINANFDLDFQKSQHTILQLQRSSEGQSFRLEAFYKSYEGLVKTRNFIPNNSQFSTAINNNGSGYAKGLEIFWRDKKSISNLDYWLSYSYLDTQRDFLNYPIMLRPNFASEHSLSVVAKKFATKWKTGFNLSYSYAKARPYYDIINQNDQNIIRHEGRLMDLNNLNFSLNYLPNLGKKNSKAFSVIVLSVSNVFGAKNLYGYNFSADGQRRSEIVAPINTFVFVGLFISFGVDKTQNAINNNL